MRFLTVLSGLLFVATGVFSIANQGASFLSIAFILGVVMIFAGTILASGYIYGRYTNREEILPDASEEETALRKCENRSQKNAHGWIMIDGTITFVLGLLVLSNQLKAEIAVVSVFGMWMLNAGVRRVVTSTYIDRVQKSKNYYWTLGTGILNTVAGIYAFYNSSAFHFPVASLLGCFFVLQGISSLELGIHMPHRNKTNKLLNDIEDKLQQTMMQFNMLKKEDLISYANEHRYPIDKEASKEEILKDIRTAINLEKQGK